MLTQHDTSTAEMLASLLHFGQVPKTPGDLDNLIPSDLKDEALTLFNKRRYKQPITLAVIMEGLAHKTFNLISHRVNEDPLKEGDWVVEYLNRRSRWLETHQPSEVYRVKTIASLLQKGNWKLKTPLEIHFRDGFRLSLEVMNDKAGEAGAEDISEVRTDSQ
jgi:hypothetical protein